MRLSAVLLVFLSAGLVSAIDVGNTVQSLADITNYSAGRAFTNIDSYRILQNVHAWGGNNWSVQALAGIMAVKINWYNLTYQNLTLSGTVASTFTMNMTNFTGALPISVYKNGVLDGTTSSTAGGLVTYGSSLAAPNTNYEYIIRYEINQLIFTLDSPADLTQYEYSPSLVVGPFLGTANSPNTVQNATLYTNTSGTWALRYTNKTNGSGQKYLNASTGIGLGTYMWGGIACDTLVCANSATNRTFYVRDTTPPIVGLDLNNTVIEADQGTCILAKYNSSDYLPGNGSLTISNVSGAVLKTNISINGTQTFCYSDSAGLGTYMANASSNDTSNNWAWQNKTFSVQDTVAPRINLTLSGFYIEAGMNCTFLNGTSADALQSTYTLAAYNSSGGAAKTNTTLNGTFNFCYSDSTGLGAYQANLTSLDTSGNKNSTAQTFYLVKNVPPTVVQNSPADWVVYTVSNNRTTLVCEASDAVGIQNVTFVFDGGSNVTNTTLVGGQSSWNVGWNSSDYRNYTWSCGTFNVFGNYSKTVNRTIEYLSAIVNYGCTATLSDGSNCLSSATLAANTTDIRLSGVGNCTVLCNLHQQTGVANYTVRDLCSWAVVNGSQYKPSTYGCGIDFHYMWPNVTFDLCVGNYTAYGMTTHCNQTFARSSEYSGVNLPNEGNITSIITYYNVTTEA